MTVKPPKGRIWTINVTNITQRALDSLNSMAMLCTHLIPDDSMGSPHEFSPMGVPLDTADRAIMKAADWDLEHRVRRAATVDEQS
jgi:hypothetical protein